MQSQSLLEETQLTPAQTLPAETMIEMEESAEIERRQAAVSRILSTAQNKIRRRRRKFFASFVALEVTMLFCGWMIREVNSSGNASAIYAMVAAFAVISILCALGFFLTLMHPIEVDMEELVRAGGVQSAGILIDLMHSGVSPRQYRTIYKTLTHILPQMKASDAPLLTAAHRKRLNALLTQERYDYSPGKDSLEFKLAILKAYEQIGDEGSLAVVEKLANMRGWSKRARILRGAANECLPHLRERAADTTANLTLLRGSHPEPAGKESLLRPVVENAKTSAQELLRAAE